MKTSLDNITWANAQSAAQQLYWISYELPDDISSFRKQQLHVSQIEGQ